MNSYSSTKRARGENQASASSSRSSSPSPALSPTAKAQRVAYHSARNAAAPLLCTLPPTCHPPHNAPAALANSQELETHYAKYHAFACAERSCAAVFPNARLLELHQTECHNPLALVRKERGEKIFACHLETCSRLFLDPKKRRLHLIQAHGFPKEYFFAVTNKGVGGLLKKWGEGASLIRGPWKARSDEKENDKLRDVLEAGTDETGGDSDDGDESDGGMLSVGTIKDTTSPSDELRKTLVSAHKADFVGGNQNKVLSARTSDVKGGDMDALTNSLGSLALVPPSIRFGRGGKSGQMARQSQASKSNKHAMSGRPQIHKFDETVEADMHVETSMPSPDIGVSINIDAALKALKDEVAPGSTAKQDTRGALPRIEAGFSGKTVLGGGRGRGGRGRGRGRGKDQQRGRG